MQYDFSGIGPNSYGTGNPYSMGSSYNAGNSYNTGNSYIPPVEQPIARGLNYPPPPQNIDPFCIDPAVWKASSDLLASGFETQPQSYNSSYDDPYLAPNLFSPPTLRYASRLSPVSPISYLI